MEKKQNKKESKKPQFTPVLDLLFNLAGSGLLEDTPYQEQAEKLLRKVGYPI